MTEDQILFSLMQWWLSFATGLFTALHFYSEKLGSWFAGLVLYASFGICTYLLSLLAKTSVL